MKNKLKLYLDSFRIKWKENKIKFILEYINYVLLFLFFFSIPAISGTSLSFIPIILMGAICLVTIIWNLLYDRIFIDKFSLSALLFILFVLISAIYHKFIHINKTLFLLPIMFVVFYHFFSHKNFLINSINILAFAIFMFAIYFIISYFNEIINMNFSRLGEKFDDENVIGSYFAIAICIYLYKALFKKKLLLFIPILMFVLLGVATGSKSFLLIVFIVTIFQLFKLFGRRWYIPTLIIITGVAGLFCLLELPVLSSIKTRIYDLLKLLFQGNTAADPSSMQRINIFFEGLYLFTKSPIFGLGFDGVQNNSSIGVYSHNTIIDSLANFGIFALIFIEFPIVSNIKKIFSNKSNNLENNILFKSLLIFTIINIFMLVQYSSKIYFIILAMICGYYKQVFGTKDLFALECKVD